MYEPESVKDGERQQYPESCVGETRWKFHTFLSGSGVIDAGVLFVSLLYSKPSLHYSRCFWGWGGWVGGEMGWQQNGLNGVCWRNTYQICGHAIVSCGICEAYDFCWGCGSIMPFLLSCCWYSDIEKGRRRKIRRRRKGLLITCFVWSESPCKYMNSKCRKSNLVPHWYILLFAYLPAPVVSCCISGLGTLNTQRHAYIFFFFFWNCLFFQSRLPLFPPHPCPSSPLLYLRIPPLHPTTSLIPFPLSHSDIRVYFPPGRMHDRGAGGTESKWQISPSFSFPPCTSFSPSQPLSCQRPSSARLSHPIWPHWYSNLHSLHSTFSHCEGLA